MSAGLSFPKTRRLTRTAEFAQVRREGKVLRGDLFTLATATAPVPAEQMRIGIIASRKVGGAVIRNRVRRRIREIVRKQQDRVAPGLWIVIILSARSARASYRELEDEWLRLAGRAFILAP